MSAGANQLPPIILPPLLLLLAAFSPTAAQVPLSPRSPPRTINFTNFSGNGAPPSNQPPSLPAANSNLSTAAPGRVWHNLNTPSVNYTAGGGFTVWPVLIQAVSGPSFACGFLCASPCRNLTFGIFLVRTLDSAVAVGNETGSPHVVWTANRNRPVEGYLALRFLADGNLVLSDRRGATVWSTGTSGAVAMNMTETGNLKLFGKNGSVLWQSFDHPTDTVLPEQSASGKRLVANSSATDTSEGSFYLEVTDSSYYAYITSITPTPEMYYSSDIDDSSGKLNTEKGVLLGTGPKLPKRSLPAESFLRLESDGHLRLYQWSDGGQTWKEERSYFEDYLGKCGYPTVCGKYGVCTNGQCSSPFVNSSFFEAENPRELNLGFREAAPLSCDRREEHVLEPLDSGVYYFGFAHPPDMAGVSSADRCKEACLRNCSCRAVFVKKFPNSSRFDCYLPSVVLSLDKSNRPNFESQGFIKLQQQKSTTTSVANNKKKRMAKIGWSVGAVCAALLIIAGVGGAVIAKKNRKSNSDEEEDEEESDFFQFSHMLQLPGMPTRFSYEELRRATDNFSRKLGEGGFGSVFEGTLAADGTRVAVKLLGHKGQGMKEFLAEVETIGSIHHVTLVRLVGYCAEKLHRLLVYEFMPNGSLERWIFGGAATKLDWPTKARIIRDVARGLAYLHEECRQRIIHLDIKPQNILLDDGFNAKVSDFGLSKLVEKDASQVVTTLRGTPGYMAPEWLSSVITEKVDVYSFGVLLLEIICEKRILDHSRSPRSVHLVGVLKRAAEEDRLPDIVATGDDGDEAVRMVRIAMWCLQVDYQRRPSMSTVVKAIEGLVEVGPATDLNFFTPARIESPVTSNFSSSLPPQPSSVLGPR